VAPRGGEILRFMGDAMLIVFPAEPLGGIGAACAAALDAAHDALARAGALNADRLRRDCPPIRFGIGLHDGQVAYGNVGAPERLDFTVIGPAVNRAARLETLTKELDVPLLMSQSFAAAAGRPARSLGRHRLRGLDEPVEVFALEEAPAALRTA
jgi:adenylate cyclase